MEWRCVLERRGLEVSRSKGEYMCVNERQTGVTVKMDELRYLG